MELFKMSNFVIYILQFINSFQLTNRDIQQRYTDESFGFCVETLRFISIFNPITTTLYTNKYTKISHFYSDFDTSIPVNLSIISAKFTACKGLCATKGNIFFEKKHIRAS